MHIGIAMLHRLQEAFPNMIWSYDDMIPHTIYGTSKRTVGRFLMQFGFKMSRDGTRCSEFFWSIQSGENVSSKKSFSTFEEAVKDAESWAHEVVCSLTR